MEAGWTDRHMSDKEGHFLGEKAEPSPQGFLTTVWALTEALKAVSNGIPGPADSGVVKLGGTPFLRSPTPSPASKKRLYSPTA